MIPYIEELNFPKQNGQQYATLSQATVNLTDMAEKSISTQVKIDGDIAPDFSYDWAVKYHGEKYIMPLRRPQCTKGNDSINSIIDLTFQHWAIYQLKRWPFVTIQQIEAGTYLADDEEATVQLNLGDFCELLGQVLHYYFAGAITVDLNPKWEYDKTAKLITISHTKIWNVLTEALYKQYGARWEIQAASNAWEGDNNGERYVIRVGYSTTEVNHIFEYGFEGGLLKIEQQIQSEEIRNILKGRGGEKNLPRYYFKRVPDAEKEKWGYSDDPDWVVELKDIYFTRLMPATFRSYVQGWKAAHINQKDSNGKKLYDGYTAVGEENAYSAWAYRKGYTDTKFQPIEFVADEITLTPESEDKQVEVLPGYAPYVKKDSSIWKYGPLSDTLDSDDEVYPTLQGTKFDIAVAVEQIESDDIVEKAENNAKIRNYDGASVTTDEKQFNSSTSKEFTIIVPGPNFIVNEGDSGVLEIINVTLTSKNYEQVFNYANKRIKDTPVSDYELVDYEIEVVAGDGSTQTATGITPGTYTSRIKYNVRFKGSSKVKRYTFTASYGGANLITSNTAKDEWQSTFDIWVKNIWGSTQGEHEADSAYGERVWKPILGDREGDTAKVVFTSGELAVSEDYEFTIVGYPKPDSSKTWQEKDGIGNVTAVHTSHWRITLAKSDAEMEATGQYVPSTKKQGKAGDRFVFIGTEMMHNPYVTNAEVRLADNNKDALKDVKDIKPTYVVTLDRIRLNQQDIKDDTRLRYLLTEQGGYVHTEQGGRIALEGTGYASLLELLRPGCTVSLADKRFIAPVGNIAYEKLYVQSITFTYRQPSKEDAALNPDAEITLGNDYATSANPVSMMQGDISDLQRQVGAISNVEQIVRAVGDKLYLRKDGIDDRSLSPTQFVSLLTSGDFRSGIVGGAGWGFFKDENGNWVLEADRVNVRQEMQVNTLVINQAEGRGGMEIDTAAYIEGVTRVDDTADGYVCYFDQKEGTVANLFHVGDVAYCQRWTPKNSALKFYKRRVTAVGVDHIVLAKTSAEGGSTPAEWTDSGVNGSGVPEEGDNIIHFGSYTDATRRYVKVRDVVGGGYERYLEGLSSVNSSGVEYYFVGRLSGTTTTGTPRWFIGNKDLVPNSGEDDGSYIEYKDREFNLHNVKLSVGTKLGDKPIGEYISDAANSLMAVEYSATGADGTWHSAYTNGDRYMRQSTDGGTTWSSPMLISAPDIASKTVEYATSASGTTAPTAGWSTTIPSVAEGQYLWTRTTLTMTDGSSVTSYSVAYQGEDGADAPYTVFQWAKGDYAQPTGTWSDTPLNAAAGEYVWMRSGTVTPPATAPTSWGTPIRLTGDTGKAGGDALLLDLDNEVVAVTCDADGNVISGLPATINARVFKGGTEVTSGVTYGNEATTLTMSQSGKVYTISGISKDRDTLTIKATVDGVTLKSTVNVYKVKAGADGAPATMYFLEPAESSVTRTAQGGLSVTSLGCRKLYVTGSDQRHLTTANTLTAQIYTNGVAGTETVIAADGVTNNGEVTLTDDTTAVVFTLYKGASTAEADMLDRERVPVLTDAFGLSVGGVNLLRKTNSGIINWTTNTSSNGQIVMEPGTPQSRCVFYNNATTAAPDWQMIGFALPADTIKANCYYMLSFKARVLQSNGTAGGALTQPLQLRWQISKNTGGDRLTNVESRTVTYTETRFTIMMRTTGVPTSQHRLWGYISTTGTAWEALEIWDMQLEEGVVATEYKASPLDFNYLTEALKESTTVERGVILSSLMRLGYTASDAYRVTAGMNGVLAPSTDGTDPAIWAGGDMLDATSDENSSADLDSLAKLMFRHNGNGYMCGGVVRVLDGRILIGRNRKADGTIKSDAEFAQDCIILDEEGLTYVSGGQDRLLVTSAQVGDTFETKVNAVNWSGTATAFDSIALAHYYSKEMILEPVKPEQTASEDGTEALSTTYLETWSWVPTINIAQTKTINIGSGTIAVGTVIEVSSLSTSFSITRSHSEGVQITATAELCYTDSAGKVQVVRKVNMPKQYSGNTCSFSMGTTIRHTVQVAASYFVRLTLTPNTDGMGKPLANEYKTVTPATATASGTTKTTRSDVTIIGTDGIKSIWGDGGFLANSNGVKIRGSLWINGKLVTTS